jgi:fructose-specific component phosphotransferase system IIB-like protein
VPVSNIHIETVTYSSIGTYNYKIVATDSLTGLVNQQNTFLISIVGPTTATDLVLVAGTAIANQNYLIGDPALLLTVPTYTIVPSNADISITWTLGASTPSFVTVVQPSAGVYKVQIVTASSASTGIYTIELNFNEQFSSIKRMTTFVLTVSCVRSISMLSTVPPALYYINDPFIDVIVPLYTIGPASCPYELTYSANLANGSALPNAIALLT